MTDNEIDERARQCARAVNAAGRSRDPAQLESAGFTPLMRRGLERFMEQIAPDEAWAPNDVDWGSYRRAGSKLFSDLKAYLHEVSAGGKQMVQLTGFDRDGRVCEFAFLEDVTKLDRPYLPKSMSGVLGNQWFNASGFSAKFKIDALIPGHPSFGYSTRRLGDVMTATMTLPRGYFGTLSDVEKTHLVDELGAIFRNCVRLTYDEVRPSALHLIVIEEQDDPSETHTSRHWGEPPQAMWLAHRAIELPA